MEHGQQQNRIFVCPRGPCWCRICMQTKDFERAYQAFIIKEKPIFQGD
jgi:hypothetical protein